MDPRFANAPAGSILRVHEFLHERFELWLIHLTSASCITRLLVLEVHANIAAVLSGIIHCKKRARGHVARQTAGFVVLKCSRAAHEPS